MISRRETELLACGSIWTTAGKHLQWFRDFENRHPLGVDKALFGRFLECVVDIPGIKIDASL
jgi:hypothetical protein